MKSILKNIVIVVLVLSSVLQTGRLWFGVSLDRDFIASAVHAVQSGGESDDYNEKYMLTAPYRIIWKTDKTDYGASYAKYVINNARTEADVVLQSVLGNGVFTAEFDTDFDYGTGFISYEYAFSLSPAVFSECFPHNGNLGQTSLLSSRMRLFNRITIKLDPDADGLVSVYFSDDTRGITYEYKTDISYGIINRLKIRLENIYDDGVLLYNENILNRITVTAVNPYISPDGVITLRSVERALSPVFGERPINQSSPDAESFRFANDANVVCRYNLTNDILDYSDYSLTNAQNSKELIPSFAAAVRFAERDTSIRNELYLSAYQAITDGYIFWFSCIAGLPVYFTDEIKEASGLASYAEITVIHKKVTKYRRFAHYFEHNPDGDITLYTQTPPFETAYGFVYSGAPKLGFITQ